MNAAEVFSGDSELARLARGLDWSATPLGPPEGWSASLRGAVRLILGSRYPMFVWWGPSFIQIYNDAYAPILGQRHPQALGRPAPEVWSDVWSVVGPQAEGVLRDGQSTWNDRVLLVMQRKGYTEEAYFTFSYSPAYDDDGSVGGLFCAVTEETDRLIGERRLECLRRLSAVLMEARTSQQACQQLAAALSHSSLDLPFALIYLPQADGSLHLTAATGLGPGAPWAPQMVQPPDDGPWPFTAAARSRRPATVSGLARRMPSLHAGPWPEPIDSAVVVPLLTAGAAEADGFVVLGLSPRLRLDAEYEAHASLVGEQIAGALAHARAFESEQRRAQALDELDRAKTAFFANVSHEFRTPLALMVGPLEDLAETLAPGDARRVLVGTASRNTQRLLKLVNTLLEYARVEGGRANAVFEATDLAVFTADLASSFRSACERAGLELVVDCPPLSEPVFVDTRMWEKVVLNLVSNAFKFTFKGRITIAVREVDGSEGRHAEVSVADTGNGIAAADLPKLFQRFQRIEGARGRSMEGSGIGLSLVAELVRLHGGSIAVESRPGVGSRFVVRLPFGSAHLPASEVRGAEALEAGAPPPTAATVAYVGEAMSWLRQGDAGVSDGMDSGFGVLDEGINLAAPAAAPGDAASVLLVEDNPDLRDYLHRLLAPRYHVRTAGDGDEALRMALDQPPDLVLSDVMLPGLSGLELTARLRRHARTAVLPILLLSARAGEEARIEGLDAGADDYLVKPFSARELLARVAAHLAAARVRYDADAMRREMDERMRTALAAADAGSWSMGPRPEQVMWSPEVYDMLGLHRGQPASVALALTRIHPDDGEDLMVRFHEQLAARGEIEIEYRVLLPHEGVRWHQARGRRMQDGRVSGITLDITSRKRAELLEAEQRRALESILSGASVEESLTALTASVSRLDPQARAFIVRLQPGTDAVDSVYTEHFQPAELAAALRDMPPGELLSGGYPDRELCRTLGIQACHAAPVLGVGGRPIGSFFLCLRQDRDPTPWERRIAEFGANAAGVAMERDRIETELREERVRLRAFVDQSVAGVVLYDLQGHITEVNARFCELVGRSAAQLRGAELSEITHPDDVAPSAEMLSSLLAGSRPSFFIEKRYVRPDASVVWVRKVANLLRDAQGQPRNVAAVVVDITERKQAEEALRESEQRFRVMADTAPAMLWVTDTANHLTFISRGWFEYTGQNEEAAYRNGNGWVDMVHPEDREAAWRTFVQAAQDRSAFELECRLRVVDGSYRWAINAGRARHATDGSWLGYIGSVIDVHERIQARAALQAADRRKDEFLATLAHELRNPLAPIRNALHLVKLQGGVAGHLRDMMERQLNQLVRLVDDLMEASRISRGQLELRLESLDLREVVRTAIETSRPLLEKARHDLQVHLPDAPQPVRGDAVRVAQIIVNLLNNAAKYTEEGGRIEVEVSRDGPWIAVAVCDNGVGIAAEDMPHVFEMFAQVDRNALRAQGGLGIGLALARRLAEMHGGTLQAHSEGPGRGSTFTVRLPAAARLERSRAVVPPPPALPARRVLVVDDNRDAADSLAMVLRHLGAEVHTAHDGATALNIAGSWCPAVALLDLGMPGMDGFEVARKMRSDKRLAGLKLIALTGWGQEEDRLRSRRSGFDHHLVKPVDLSLLQTLLEPAGGA
jgi:PAS domain S-box-containing protein